MIRTTHFRQGAADSTLCGASKGDVTAAPRLATCPNCRTKLTDADVVAEIARRNAAREERLVAFCRDLAGEGFGVAR